MITFYFISIFLLIFVFSEFLKKIFKLRSETSRKIYHVLSALLSALFPFFLSLNQIIFICSFFVIFLIIFKKLDLLPALTSVKRKTFGEILFPIGVAIVAIIFIPISLNAYIFGVLIMGISDAFAGYFGTLFNGKKLIWSNKKTHIGFFIFFISSLLIGVTFKIFTNQGTYLGFFSISIICSFIESICPWGTDNAILPISAALLYFLLI